MTKNGKGDHAKTHEAPAHPTADERASTAHPHGEAPKPDPKPPAKPETPDPRHRIVLTPAKLPHGKVDQPYRHLITAEGGGGHYDFSLASGKLPEGVTMAGGGLISGTLEEKGEFEFEIQAHDANNLVGSQKYAVEVS